MHTRSRGMPGGRLRGRLPALAIVLLAASCGGEPSSAVDADVAAYADQLTRVTDQYRRSVLEVGVPEGGDAADVLGTAAVTMWAYVGAVAGLEPPAQLVDVHDAYVAAFMASATYMNDATAALEGVALEDMTATLAAAFGSTASELGEDVTAACRELEGVVAAEGITIRLGCDG